jgi:hypothetical protein
MTPVSVTQIGTGRSTVVAIDNFTNPFNVGLITTLSGTATYNIEISPQDAMDAAPTVWGVPAISNGLTAAAAVALTVPARALSINITSGTGTVTAYVVQAGIR